MSGQFGNRTPEVSEALTVTAHHTLASGFSSGRLAIT